VDLHVLIEALLLCHRAALKQPAPPAVSVLSDPFGMGDFGSHDSGDPSQQELENAIGLLDKRLLEMKVSESQFLIDLQNVQLYV
jgi:hypothetical protein